MSIVNPFASSTKGEILSYASDLESLIARTTTCWGYPNVTIGHPGVTHCGHCLPCLVRRFALASAGMSDNDEIYLESGYLKAVKRNRLSGRPEWSQARQLVGFTDWIKSAKPTDLFWSFGGHFLHLAQNVRQQDLQAVRNLYGRFAAEIDGVRASR